MRDGDGREVEFDIESVMAEIKVAAPEFVPFLAWCAENTEGEDVDAGQIERHEFQSVLELVYSYSRSKNEDEEERLTGG